MTVGLRFRSSHTKHVCCGAVRTKQPFSLHPSESCETTNVRPPEGAFWLGGAETTMRAPGRWGARWTGGWNRRQGSGGVSLRELFHPIFDVGVFGAELHGDFVEVERV